jgi:hypothetical protein
MSSRSKESVRVVVEDLVAKFAGKPEKVLPKGTSIRFDVGDISLSCKITDDGLEIIKSVGLESESRITVNPISSNAIFLR